MKRSTRTTILLIIFASLSLISILTLHYTHTLPTEKKLITTLWTYGHYGTFDYVATLRENTVYYNKSTLRPGEGPVYMAITDHVNITFNYTFESSLPANVTIEYQIEETLKTPRWQRLLYRTNPTITEYNEINLLEISINNIPLISLHGIEQLVATMNTETGAYAYSYNVTVATEIHVEANTSKGQISETFTPAIAVKFSRGTTEGNVLLIENLYQAKTGEITQTDIVPQDWVTRQRHVSYVLSAFSFASLTFATYWFLKTRPAKPTRSEALIEEVIDPFKEIIIETAEEPQTPKEHLLSITTISMKALEDLVKVADIVGKPIVHFRRPPETHVFYVVDETTRYEYAILESSIVKITTEEDEEE